MNKNVVIGIVAGIVAIAVIVGGWFLFSANSTPKLPTPAPTSSQDASASPAPLVDATGAPISSDDATKPPSAEKVAEATKQVEESRKFEDATEVANFSKDEVQEILKSATEYTYAALTNTTLLSGDWAKDGKDMTVFAGGIDQYFSTKVREQIKSIPKDDPQFGTKTQTLAYYVVSGSRVAASPACAVPPVGQETAPDYHGITCPGELKISDMKYEPTETDGVPGVMVTYSVEMDVPLVLVDGNKDVSQHVKYDFKLNFINNENYQPEATDKKFVIDYYDNKVNFGKVLG